MVIAIDGPAGSGKSTVARMVADKLGFYFLNTGSFYRAYTLSALDRGIDPLDREKVLENAQSIRLSVKDGAVCIDGKDEEARLHTPLVDRYASPVSADPRIREMVNETVRSIAKGLDIVTEGRDTTTVVFPDADYRFYFDASPEIRARRRRRRTAPTLSGRRTTITATTSIRTAARCAPRTTSRAATCSRWCRCSASTP